MDIVMNTEMKMEMEMMGIQCMGPKEIDAHLCRLVDEMMDAIGHTIAKMHLKHQRALIVTRVAREILQRGRLFVKRSRFPWLRALNGYWFRVMRAFSVNEDCSKS